MPGQSITLRILIADDHHLLRDTLQVFLNGEGNFETITVAGFKEAEALVEEGPAFDLVLLDYTMPGMDGDAVASSIKKIDPDVSTILITGAPIKEDDPRLSAFDAYLRKPFADLEEVHDAMDRVGRPTE